MRSPEQFVLKLANVSVRRGAEIVLHDLNWKIRAGENWAVVGPNGSGKSSLAAAISGDAATIGEIEYFGGADIPVCQGPGRQECLPHQDPYERIASVSFNLHRQFAAQADGYYQSRWYPGEEEATLTARQVLGARNAAFEKLARELRISGLLNRQVLHLSTGEMRRLLIARALLIKPALLLLDEPFIGLDVRGREQLSKILQRIMKHGQQIIVFTARPEELPREINHRLNLKHSADVPRAALPLAARENARTRTSSFPIVEFRDVTVNAGNSAILANFNWLVRSGERWAVIGPNGAGKTTLLSLITSDHPQSYAQDISVFGRRRGDGQTLWELKAGIGWASPDVALHYDTLTTTFDFICTGFFETLGLYRQCSRAQERAARTWLNYFGLADFANRPFRLLSDGQQRLALLARALVKRPPLLILDEPCQGLDKNARKLVLRAIDSVCRCDGTTLIMVSHYESELPPCISNRLKLRRTSDHFSIARKPACSK